MHACICVCVCVMFSMKFPENSFFKIRNLQIIAPILITCMELLLQYNNWLNSVYETSYWLNTKNLVLIEKDHAVMPF